MKKEIQWKRKRITLDVDNITIDADIVWWAKDYYIEILSPHRKSIPGKHMMYMIPAKFVLDDTETSDSNIRLVPILESCKKLIIDEYSV